MSEQLYKLTGAIMPYTRMTRLGKFVNDRAQEYMTSQEAIRWQITATMRREGYKMLPDKTPLAIMVDYWPPKGKGHVGDGDNILKAIIDAAQKIVFRNDGWFDEYHLYRHEAGGDGYASVTISTREDLKNGS
jgi:crossover junction endodeoxyribonuclease RusA